MSIQRRLGGFFVVWVHRKQEKHTGRELEHDITERSKSMANPDYHIFFPVLGLQLVSDARSCWDDRTTLMKSYIFKLEKCVLFLEGIPEREKV